MLGRYQKYMPKPTNIAELKTALLSIWYDFIIIIIIIYLPWGID